MSKIPIRFLHASDLLLEQPISSLKEQPEHVETVFQRAAFQAAQRLFHAAVTEEADFVILSGGILNPFETGPIGPLFLIEQFNKLAEAGIEVYWSGSAIDRPENWPAVLELPENVFVFRSGVPEELIFTKRNLPTVRLVGMSRNSPKRKIRLSQFSPDAAGLFSIAVVHGMLEPESLSHFHFNYWAMGGQTERSTYKSPVRKTAVVKETENTDVMLEPYIVHYPGATLGRNPHESGVFGATLVDVAAGERPILKQIPTAPIRWKTEKIFVETGTTLDELRSDMMLRLKNWKGTQNDCSLFVRWIIHVPENILSSSLVESLRSEAVQFRILEDQRREFGFSEPIMWPLSLSVPTPDMQKANLYEQKTILGDFLRSVHHFQANVTESVPLEGLIPPSVPESLSNKLLLTESDGTVKQTLTQQTLKEAAQLGYELLGGIDLKSTH